MWFLFEAGLAGLRLAGLGQQELVDIVSEPGIGQITFLSYLALGAALLWLMTMRALATALKLRRVKSALAGTLTSSLFLLILAAGLR